jgi:serine/threonine-protein kinase
VSQTGALVYFQGTGGQSGRGRTAPNSLFGWLDAGGGSMTAAGQLGQYGDFDLSPDGSLIAVTRQETGAAGADIWVIDWQRGGVATPVTRDSADDINPVWSPDNRRVAYTTYRSGSADVYVRGVNSVDPEVPLLESAVDEHVEGWSFDGRYLLYLSGAGSEIHALPLTSDARPDGDPIPIPAGSGRKDEPQLSRDGKWLAYTSDESGAFEVWIASFPTGEPRVKVTRDGGGQPRWSADGKRLFYRSTLDNTIMVVDVQAGSAPSVGVPRAQARPIVNNLTTRDATRHQLGVVGDGTRFLVRVPPATAAAATAGNLAASGVTVFLRGQGVPAANIARGGAREAGRGGGAAQAPMNGLTVMLDWPARLRGSK